MKTIIRFSFLLSLWMLGACQAKQADQGVTVETMMENMESTSGAKYDTPPPPPEEPASKDDYDGADEQANTAPVERKIIRQGSIAFETEDVAATHRFLLQKIAEQGGYVSQENANDFDDRIQHQLTFRIPSDKFDVFVEQISSNAKKLDHKNISAQDVTEEFIDITVRLKTKKQLENRYLELLKKAQKVTEILEIEREIGNLRSEIESFEGRLKYLSNQVSLGTLEVTYYQKIAISAKSGSRFGNALKGGWDNLTLFLLGLTYLWPFLLLFFGVLVVLWRLRKKRLRSRQL